MVRQKSGKIINISSCSAKKADALQAAYNSSKSALLGLTRVTALELGPYGICCNAICPGATDTEMVRRTFLTSSEVEQEWIEKTALKRLGKPQDVANVAAFLASELSDHMTGEALIVSAGELMGQ
jgi:NAD(P)-dependent dehydrogenase (short-subunit alcohol dehydrogenase family)